MARAGRETRVVLAVGKAIDVETTQRGVTGEASAAR